VIENETAQDALERPPAATARHSVLAQHLELRQLLSDGLAQVTASLQGGRTALTSLRMLVGFTYHVFVRHLSAEEALIFPILEDDLPLGPERARRLRREHDQQREEFAALFARRYDAEADELGARFRALATALLDDIEHEERELLTPDVIRDDGVVIDQAGG
jgi:hypothetical protein